MVEATPDGDGDQWAADDADGDFEPTSPQCRRLERPGAAQAKPTAYSLRTVVYLGFSDFSAALWQVTWVCRSAFVTRFLSTKRLSLGSMGLPQAAQMAGFGFLKNMSASQG